MHKSYKQLLLAKVNVALVLNDHASCFDIHIKLAFLSGSVNVCNVPRDFRQQAIAKVTYRAIVWDHLNNGSAGVSNKF